jgi:hypothetical protein
VNPRALKEIPVLWAVDLNLCVNIAITDSGVAVFVPVNLSSPADELALSKAF